MTAVTPVTGRAAPRPETRASYEAAVECVIREMRARPDLPLDLGEMAVMVHVSRCHFDRLFRRVTGISPRHFQTAVRLQTASRLLLTTDRRVTDVCFDVGYESLGSFITKFTETFGLSPQRLRELASDLDRPWSQWLQSEIVSSFAASSTPPELRGNLRLAAEGELNGLIFIGLFATALPVGAPLACAILTGPGPFALGPVPDEPTWLFAVAIRWCEKPLEFLLDDQTLRGGGMQIAPRSTAPVELTLRPPAPNDPPINLALPYLIVQKVVTK